ncbi:unnamed protein product [Arabis nemorensis]|uniref:HAT C-terminal dimerisation domain-containing protein n=1 Tax=Arabis nemorensis TaxID=586526 RepID=A0A565BJA1_9BRAS|nr:unnamed protein product [Arabis nemorensis]
MFGSDEWHGCNHSKCVKGRNAYDIVMSYAFWTSVMVVLKVFNPLVKVLRLADGEKIPSLGFMYGEILEAKKSIKEAFDNLERSYQPVFQIIDEKMKGRLDSPLHIAAYFLNPFYYYKDSRIYDVEVMQAFIACVETFYHGDFKKQSLVVNDEVHHYRNKSDTFGIALALKGCEKKDETFDPDTVEEWLMDRLEKPDEAVNFVLTTQAPRVRDLYDDDFESEEEDTVDMEFEPDVFQEDYVYRDIA